MALAAATATATTTNGGVCQPSHGHTYLTIGQDLFSIQDYVTQMYNYSLHDYMRTSKNNGNLRDNNSVVVPPPQKEDMVPAAYMVYTDIQELRGLDRPVDYGSGIEYADGLKNVNAKERFVGGLQMGLWLSGSKGCRDIVEGKLDANLERLYQYLENAPFEQVFVRLGYEFDNPEFGYSDNPPIYRQAFQQVVDNCRKRQKCHEKTSFVWHSWAAGLPKNQSLLDYYPGREYVDWIGISLFQQFYPHSPLGTVENVLQVLDFAKEQEQNYGSSSSSIPIMIAESTPFGGIPHLKDPWEEWFVPVLELIDKYDIAMWSYINCDWDSQPMWKNVGFGNTRLAHNQTILDLWYKHVVAQNTRFIQKDVICTNTKKHHHHHHRSDIDDSNNSNNNVLPPFSSILAMNEFIPQQQPPPRDLNEAFGGISRFWYGILLVLITFWCFRSFRVPDEKINREKQYYRERSKNKNNTMTPTTHKLLSFIAEGDEEEESLLDSSSQNQHQQQTSNYGAL
mmetsp:Transcript_16234/g.21243  ORF Transcript_16234/g.21243 Transcript_16234/m.21243 type:complete len:508 (-) Transcript_16234:169-1692(-)